MAEQFDVTIIGSGPGGYVAAVRAGQLGLKVAIVEKEKDARLGGTCGLRGCIPTKALLNAAHLYQKAGEFEKFGLKVKELGYDWPGVQKYKSDIVAKNAAGVTYLMKKNKATVFNGFGKIAGPGKVEVDLAGVFVGYSYSWSPYFRDRLLRGGLRIAHVPGGGFTASYSQARHTHEPNLAHGEVGVLQRGLLLDLREPHGRTAFLFTLFPPSSPVSVLGGLMCGPALLGPDPQPSVTRIVLVRLPEWPPLLSTAECIMDPGASLADDLAALSAAVTDPGQAERLIVEFLSQRSGAGYDHVTIGPYRALVDFFDREWIARAFPGG